MEQDKGALQRMNSDFENSKKEQIISFLRDQSKFDRYLNNFPKYEELDDETNDSYLLSSITNTTSRLPLNSVRPKTAAITRKFQTDVVDNNICKSKSSPRPRSSYGCRRPHQLRVTHEEHEGFRKRANTTEMSRIDEVDAVSNASTRSVTPDLEDIDDSVFISPLSPQENNLYSSPTLHTRSNFRRRVKSNTNETNTRLKHINDDFNLLEFGNKRKIFTGNTNTILPSPMKNKDDTENVGRTTLDEQSDAGVSSSSESYENGLTTSEKSPIINTRHGMVTIDSLDIDGQTIGVQGIAMIECDAGFYKKMRNKSAPARKTGKEHYKVYHLPPLENTRKESFENTQTDSMENARTGSLNNEVKPTTAQVTDLISS